MTRAAPIAFFAFGLALSGCGSFAADPIEQTVSGIANSNDSPANGVAVKIVAKGASCKTAAAETVTDSDGAFSFKRTAWLGKIDVIVQDDTLCIRSGGNWLAVWHSAYGPAPRKLVFQCTGSSGTWSCQAQGDAIAIASHGG